MIEERQPVLAVNVNIEDDFESFTLPMIIIIIIIIIIICLIKAGKTSML